MTSAAHFRGGLPPSVSWAETEDTGVDDRGEVTISPMSQENDMANFFVNHSTERRSIS
jgi:hypothetical protein